MNRIPRLHIQRWINPQANKARAYDIKRQGASQKSGHKAIYFISQIVYSKHIKNKTKNVGKMKTNTNKCQRLYNIRHFTIMLSLGIKGLCQFLHYASERCGSIKVSMCLEHTLALIRAGFIFLGLCSSNLKRRICTVVFPGRNLLFLNSINTLPDKRTFGHMNLQTTKFRLSIRFLSNPLVLVTIPMTHPHRTVQCVPMQQMRSVLWLLVYLIESMVVDLNG